MIKRIKRLIVEIFEIIIADCGNCLHQGRCPFRDRNTSCFEEGKGNYYIKKVHKNK